MKRLKVISILISICLIITSCSSKSITNNNETKNETIINSVSETEEQIEDKEISFETKKIREDLKTDIENKLNEVLNTKEIEVKKIEVGHVSKDYIETKNYNSKSNIIFGYDLNYLDQKFSGDRYIFTTDDNKHTIVKKFEEYKNPELLNAKLSSILTKTGLVVITIAIVAKASPFIIANGANAMNIVINLSPDIITNATLKQIIDFTTLLVSELATNKDKSISEIVKSVSTKISEKIGWIIYTEIVKKVS